MLATTRTQFEAMKQFLNEGKSIFLALGEGGEKEHETNVNYFTEEYGIEFSNDALIRAVFFKYFHPKVGEEPLLFSLRAHCGSRVGESLMEGSGCVPQEVCITNGVVNREINRAAGKQVSDSITHKNSGLS